MQPYDPLDYGNLAKSVVQALLGGPDEPLPPREMFEGSGVYAIYYHGDFPGYLPLVKAAEALPIYVGKAVPQGARKGGRRVLGGGGHLKGLREKGGGMERGRNFEL